VPGANQAAVVDLQSRKQTTAWETGGLRSNFPMAWRDPDGPLAVVFRSLAKLALLDVATGAAAQSVNTDDVVFDSKRERIYVTCGEGAVGVLQRAPEGLRRLGHAKTASGARTSLFAPALDRLFIAAPARSPCSGVAILVFQPTP
jgi:hypothetical protein